MFKTDVQLGRLGGLCVTWYVVRHVGMSDQSRPNLQWTFYD